MQLHAFAFPIPLVHFAPQCLAIHLVTWRRGLNTTQQPNPETAAICDALLFMISENPENVFGLFRVVGILGTAEYGFVSGTDYGLTLLHLCRIYSGYGEGRLNIFRIRSTPQP